MSQVLEKPILLDETGQEIVEKLDDIKDAIGMGGEFTPVMIKVTTPPAKIAYMAGEPLDLAGIVVSLIAANGVHIDVTDQCVFNPANGTTLTSADTSVAISYYWYKDDVTFTTSLAIGVKQLASIAITTPPTETEYMVGETLDLTGIVVVATYDDSTFLDVTSRCTFNPVDGTTLTMNDTGVTVTYTEGGVTKTATQAITVSAPIYGVEWDGTATTAWTRTDLAADFADPNPYYSGMSDTPSSPFDTIQPWAGMTAERIGSYDDYVKIPKFWYKLTQNGDGLKVQISNMAVDGFHVSPAHMDRGDGQGERDYVYVARYLASSTYESRSGFQPYGATVDFARNQYISGDKYLIDFATWFTILLLYLVEYANWDSQTVIGMGVASDNSMVSTGYTDSMPYHTGTMKTSKGTKGAATQYRNIEGLWDNKRFFVDGLYSEFANSGRVTTYYIEINPSKYAAQNTGFAITRSLGGDYFPKSFEIINENGYFPMFFPRSSGGSDTTYCPDYHVAGQILYYNCIYDCGGDCEFYSDPEMEGLFAMHAKRYDSGTCFRLMKLPSNS